MSKKRKLGRGAAPPKPRVQHKGQSLSSHHTNPNKSSSSKNKNKPNKLHQQPTIPFDPGHAILLVGDGDLSFSASLVAHHGCTRVTATVLEPSLEALVCKYPQAAGHAATVSRGKGGEGQEDEDAGDEDEDDVEDDTDNDYGDDDSDPPRQLGRPRNRVLFGIDATSMGGRGKTTDHNNSARTPRHSLGRQDRILFNFPHVGGKSTDVNRQVRYNQELLVAFFRRALLLLAPGGAIVVTLFEGEPYTLWNIRDLARHAGLQVDRSFRFQFAAYPGYHHARTLGIVRRGGRREGDDKEEDDGKDDDDNDDNDNDNDNDNDISQTAWRGEDRPARSYVFVRRDEVLEREAKKRRRPEDSSDEEG